MRKKWIIVILLIMLSVGASAFFLTKGADSSTGSINLPETGPGTASAETQSNEASLSGNVQIDGKQDNRGNPYIPPPAQQPDIPGSVSQDNTGLSRIDGSVTALLSSGDSSIKISFYVQGPGYFTVQQHTSAGWQTLAENIYYLGTGGLPAATMAPDEQTVTLRLLRADSGQSAAATPEMTVSRQDVLEAGGIRTYKIP